MTEIATTYAIKEATISQRWGSRWAWTTGLRALPTARHSCYKKAQGCKAVSIQLESWIGKVQGMWQLLHAYAYSWKVSCMFDWVPSPLDVAQGQVRNQPAFSIRPAKGC